MGMGPRMNFLQGGDAYMCVDLGGVQPGVPEHGLDVADIRPAFQHVRGAGVTEEVAGALLGDSGLLHRPRYPVSEVG